MTDDDVWPDDLLLRAGAGADDAAPGSGMWDGDPATMPTWHRPFCGVLPDLSRIPQERWREVLLPLDPQRRLRAAENNRLRQPHLGAAIRLALDMKESIVELGRAQVARGPELPAPTAQRRGAGRQLNVRLARDDYERLAQAAELLGERPTTLARLLVNSGSRRVLAEQARILAGEPPRDR